MQTTRTPRTPAADEYAPYYAGYVGLAPEGDIVRALEAQTQSLLRLFESVPRERRGGYRYAEGKWTIEEVVGHIVDIERVFSYRAMCFTRGMGDVELAGVDQDVMVAASGAAARDDASLAREFLHLRTANVLLFDTFGDKALDTRGVASGATFSVRAILAMMYGHAQHHGNVLQERYLGANGEPG